MELHNWEEKVEIALSICFQRQWKEHSLTTKDLFIVEKKQLKIVEGYTVNQFVV
jgi:ATP-dependent Lon protease